MREATAEQSDNHVLMLTGIHWPDLDEDLSVDGLIERRPAAPPSALGPLLMASRLPDSWRVQGSMRQGLTESLRPPYPPATGHR